MKKLRLRIRLFRAKLRLKEFDFSFIFYKGRDIEQLELLNSIYKEQLQKIEKIKSELRS